MASEQPNTFDVAVLGGGPAGATCAALLRKYNPGLSVFVAERDQFPRDHVGESQLPGCAQICAEMGCWDKVEAAGFPIKIGASYTWGRNNDKWDFDFYPVFVDLQGTPEELFFATLAEEVFQELAPHLEGLEPTVEP